MIPDATKPVVYGDTGLHLAELETVSTSEPEADFEQRIAGVAGALFAPGTMEGVLYRVTELTVAMVEGCDAAGIFLVEDGRVITKACTDPIVRRLDSLQFEVDEGPCLDALTEAATFYAQDLATDQRWRRFGQRAVEAGMRSLLAFPLSSTRLGALNLYAGLPAAFGATDRAKGAILATLAGLALDSTDHDGPSAKLYPSLRTREVIGQAQGILMEREHITPDQAFDVLHRASQHLDVRLREVAESVVETGEAPTSIAATVPGQHHAV